MTVLRWAETDRETLRRVLPEALVLWPVGATEQHGPHLATGTDALLASTVCERAAEVAAADAARQFVIAPTLPLGASDHHLPFGGTLSLSPETLLAVLVDVARSLATQGGRRLVVVNGHGGNTGICRAFAGIASTRHGLAVGYLDYWWLAKAEETNLPGHAGEFETSLMLAVRADLATPPPLRDAPATQSGADVEIHSAEVWRAIDGYSDEPERADADQGRRRLDHIVAELAARLVELARTL